MGTELNALLLELFLDPHAFPAGIDPIKTDFSEFDPKEPVFSAYCIKALELMRSGKASNQDLRSAVDVVAALHGPNREYALDLIRRVAKRIYDTDAEEEATDRHLRLLVAQANANHGRGAEDKDGIRAARRIAKRALDIVEAATAPIDPDLRADVHLAYGGSFARSVLAQLAMAFTHYAIGLRLKREAGNDEAVKSLEELLGDMLEHSIGKSVGASVFGGAGIALFDLEAGYEAAKTVGRRDLILNVGLNLAEAYRGVSQPHLAEAIFRSLANDFDFDPGLQREVDIGLAAAISEQHRYPEALAILEPLLAKGMDDQLGLICIGNCRRETGDFSGAREIFERLLRDLPPLEEGQVPHREIHLKVLLGQLACWQGDQETGLRLLREALSLAKSAPPVLDDDLKRSQIAAECFLDAGHRDEARAAVDHALHIRSWHLGHNATPQVLDSILNGARELDFYDVEIALAGGGEGAVYALLSAEAAKGRLLNWSRFRFDPEMIKAARVFERRQDLLDRVRTWLKNQSAATRVVSLFAATRGLAVFSIDVSGEVKGRWVTPFDYPVLAREVFEPWEAVVARAHESGSGLWDIANVATEHLLRVTGELLWRAFPDLAAGGERLVLIPHRMFRSIPMAGARLPDGTLLGERYRQITVIPSLTLFSDAIERQARKVDPRRDVRALVDPDGSLPFARLEALTLGDDCQIAIGEDVTGAALREAFRADGSKTVHLSCHGAFDESNAWSSSLMVSDGELKLSDLLLESPRAADLVVLGACEAGKSQRTPSDEPIGFAELLVQSGTGSVVSPVWNVDDFASVLFMVEFYRRREDGVASAVGGAASWLRQLTALETRSWLKDLRRDIDARLKKLPERDIATIDRRLDAIDAWLYTLSPRDRPFSRPLDWAGFQMTGLFPAA